MCMRHTSGKTVYACQIVFGGLPLESTILVVRGHVATRTYSAITKVSLAARTGVAPPETLSTLQCRVLIDPWQCPTNFTVEEDVFVKQNLEVTSYAVIFKIKFDCGVRAFVTSGGDNPKGTVNNFELSE